MGHTVELRELDRTECLRLLGGAVIGRVVFTDVTVPVVYPVNYVIDGEEIIFRTSARGTLMAAVGRATVVFEVGDIEPRTHTGWSVLGVGEARQIVDVGRLTRLSTQVPLPWVPGHAECTVAIPLRLLSGRRLTLAPWVSDRLCGTPW